MADVPAHVRSWLGDPVAAGAVAGAGVGCVEIALMGAAGRPGLALALLGVFAVAGGLAGAATAIMQALVARARLPWWAGALAHALPANLVLVPLGRHLFQGAYAATLPGASLAPIAVPIGGTLAVAIAIAIGGAILGDARPARRALVAALLVIAAAVLDGANRRMFRSGYPELHMVLTSAVLVAAARALAIAAGATAPRAWARAATGLALAAIAVVTAAYGLGRAADRARVAHRGDDARHLVRAARALVDLDGDGVSAILGGGDCDDLDPRRYAGARDVPGDGIDQDCVDGDARIRVAPPPDPVRVASLASWRQGDGAPLLARTHDMNVLVISIDALRADQVDGDDFPAIARLLRGSTWFRHGLAPAAGTDVSLTTFVTGRWNPFQPVGTTLFEALAATGRITHAVLPREVLRYVPETLLTRGLTSFDRVVGDVVQEDVGDRVTGPATTDRALAFLDGVGAARFALWVHYFDIHEHSQLDVPADALDAIDDGGFPNGHRYRALLGVIDRELYRLLDGLAQRGLADDTIVVFFSDHGESLGEDPRLPDHHGLVVYQALTHVPIAVRVPGQPVAAIADDGEPASLVDLAPTILGLVGAAGMTPLDGVDLTPDVLGAPAALGHHDRALVMNEQDQWAVVQWPWKLLVRPADNLTELYDLAGDPGETHDLAEDHPDVVRELRGRYGEFPPVPMDRTQAGRQWREAQAQPPPRPRTR